MQQPVPSSSDIAPPPAPPAPQAPGAGRPSAVALPDGPLPLDGLPKNAQELRGLQERREILRDQLDRATNRRGQLVRALNNTDPVRGGIPQEARAGVQQRLDLLDARILQLERDQALTERLIANAPANVLAQATVEDRRDSQRVDQEDATAAGFAAFGFGVLLTLIVGRIRRRFARRRAGKMPAAALPAEDPRIERLTQAVDAIAEEVERIGEGQRFVTQLLAARPEPLAVRAEAERR